MASALPTWMKYNSQPYSACCYGNFLQMSIYIALTKLTNCWICLVSTPNTTYNWLQTCSYAPKVYTLIPLPATPTQQFRLHCTAAKPELCAQNTQYIEYKQNHSYFDTWLHYLMQGYTFSHHTIIIIILTKFSQLNSTHCYAYILVGIEFLTPLFQR